MKKTITLRIAMYVFILGMLITGCSKGSFNDSVKSNSVLPGTKIPAPSGKFIDPALSGYLTGIILPIEAKPVIVLHGPGGDITLTTDDYGSLGKSSVPQGMYTLSIYPVNRNYGSYTINDLDINPDAVTDIGTVILNSLNSGGLEAAGN